MYNPQYFFSSFVFHFILKTVGFILSLMIVLLLDVPIPSAASQACPSGKINRSRLLETSIYSFITCDIILHLKKCATCCSAFGGTDDYHMWYHSRYTINKQLFCTFISQVIYWYPHSKLSLLWVISTFISQVIY